MIQLFYIRLLGNFMDTKGFTLFINYFHQEYFKDGKKSAFDEKARIEKSDVTVQL